MLLQVTIPIFGVDGLCYIKFDQFANQMFYYLLVDHFMDGCIHAVF